MMCRHSATEHCTNTSLDTRQYMSPCIRTSTRLSVCIHPSIHPSTYPSMSSCTRPFIHLTTFRAQLDVVGTDDYFPAFRSRLQKLRTHVWSKSANIGQVVCAQFTYAPITGFVASAAKVSRSVQLTKMETKVSIHRIRLPPVYFDRKGY